MNTPEAGYDTDSRGGRPGTPDPRGHPDARGHPGSPGTRGGGRGGAGRRPGGEGRARKRRRGACGAVRRWGGDAGREFEANSYIAIGFEELASDDLSLTDEEAVKARVTSPAERTYAGQLIAFADRMQVGDPLQCGDYRI